MAVELTGDSLIPPTGHVHKSLSRNKQGKLSQAIYKSYLKALAELITAAIPKETLQQEYSLSTSNTLIVDAKKQKNDKAPLDDLSTIHRFLVPITKDRISGLFTLLHTETKRGKGPCGPLVPLILRVLANVAMTSVRAAEQSVSEGIWKSMIRLPPLHNNNNNNNNNKSTTKTMQRREDCRTAFLHFVRVLLSTQDTTVLHYISAHGSKDRKQSPGCLVLALGFGLRDVLDGNHKVQNNEDDNDNMGNSSRTAYYKEIIRLLQTLGNVLSNSPNNVLSARRWADLLSTDVLLNVSDLSLHAPPLAKPELFQSVLDGSDNENNNVNNNNNNKTMSLMEQG